MAITQKVVETKQTEVMVDLAAMNGEKALAEFRTFNQEMVDEIVKQMALDMLLMIQIQMSIQNVH
jgi:acetaldehyde dehydrogenase / alcohol dehydrogenase